MPQLIIVVVSGAMFDDQFRREFEELKDWNEQGYFLNPADYKAAVKILTDEAIARRAAKQPELGVRAHLTCAIYAPYDDW